MAFLLFPMPLVVAAVTGLSWTDPLIGELRKRSRLRLYPSLPMAIYFLIVIASLEMFSDMPLLAIVILASVGSIGAIAAEKPKIPVDDDFIMLVLPLVIMTLVYEYMVIADLARI